MRLAATASSDAHDSVHGVLVLFVCWCCFSLPPALSALRRGKVRASVTRARPWTCWMRLGNFTICALGGQHAMITAVYPSFHPMARKRMHALKGLACRKRMAAASSPAATCKQGTVLTSPARHACGCARPSRARLCRRNSKILSDGSKT